MKYIKNFKLFELFNSKGTDFYIDYFNLKWKEIGYYFYVGDNNDNNKVEVTFTIINKNNLLIDFMFNSSWDKIIDTNQKNTYLIYNTIKNICIEVINKLNNKKGYDINTLTYDANNNKKEKISKHIILSVNSKAKFSKNQYGSIEAKITD